MKIFPDTKWKVLFEQQTKCEGKKPLSAFSILFDSPCIFCWIFFWTYLLFYIRYIFGTWCYANTIFFSFYLKNYKNKMSYKKQWNYTYKFEIDKFSGFPFSFSFFKLEKEHLLWKMDIGSSVGAWKAISHSISPFAIKKRPSH
jgi:hypothetical protein